MTSNDGEVIGCYNTNKVDSLENNQIEFEVTVDNGSQLKSSTNHSQE
jgi:hypothetical protein